MAQDELDDFRRFNERGFQTDPDHAFRARLLQHLNDVHQAYELHRAKAPEPEWPPDLSWEERMPPDDEYRARSDRLVRYGIQVHTQVRLDTATRANPLLLILVDKLPDWNASDWVSNATVNPSVHRHVSIVHWDDMETVPDWRNKLESLYEKFDDKHMRLYGTRVTSGGTLVLDPKKDPIASDPIVQEFHNKNLKWNPVHTHEKDNAKYWEKDNWESVVPEMHVSM